MLVARFSSHESARNPTDSAHVDALLHLKRLDVDTADGVGVVQDNPGFGLDVKLEVAAGAEVAASDRQHLFDDLSSDIVVDEVPFALQRDQDAVFSVQSDDLSDQRRVFWRIVKLAKVCLAHVYHLKGAILAPHELLHGEVSRVLEDTKHGEAA